MLKISGNPFVDTGSRIISYFVDKSFNEVMIEDVEEVIFGNGFGKKITETNFIDFILKLKSLSMVFTKNTMLMNGKNIPQVYENYIKGLFDDIRNQEGGVDVCDICGREFKNNFQAIIKTAKEKAGAKAKKNIWLGRDHFPLVGSMGNDSQTFPQGIHIIKICSHCLLAVQFLPILSILYKGQLVLFNSTKIEISDTLVSAFLDDLIEKVQVQGFDNKIDNTKISVRDIIGVISDKLDDSFFDSHFSLILHLYSNSGTEPKYDKEIIPGTFLKKLKRLKIYNSDYNHCVNIKFKKGLPFYECVLNKKEFFSVYQTKKYDGVSVLFFDEYFKSVLGYQDNKLNGFKQIALFLSELRDKNDLKLLMKHSMKDDEYIKFRIIILKVLKDNAKENHWNSEKHLELFMDDEDGLFKLNYKRQWLRIIHFYFHKVIQKETLANKPLRITSAFPKAYFNIQKKTAPALKETDFSLLRKIIKSNPELFLDYSSIVYQDENRYYLFRNDLLFLLTLDSNNTLEPDCFSKILQQQDYYLKKELYQIAAGYIEFYKLKKGKNNKEIYKIIIKPYHSKEMDFTTFIYILNMLYDHKIIGWDLKEYVLSKKDKKEIIFVWFNYLRLLLDLNGGS